MKHIAILRQPFFDMVIHGEKTIESRWSMKKIAPYKKIKPGDEVLLKETNRDVTAVAIVEKVEFYELTPSIADEINDKYGKEICTDKFTNWENFRNKKYCTLIWFKNLHTIEPLKVKRSNGAGWIILKD